MVMPSEIEDENYPIENPYFVEPSTGERWELSDDNFIGIEALWNHKNYWVNLQSLDGGCMVCIILVDVMYLNKSINSNNFMVSNICLNTFVQLL